MFEKKRIESRKISVAFCVVRFRSCLFCVGVVSFSNVKEERQEHRSFALESKNTERKIKDGEH